MFGKTGRRLSNAGFYNLPVLLTLSLLDPCWAVGCTEKPLLFFKQRLYYDLL
jgi:hypothetical protein